jgi:hypothetical protein
MISAARSKLLDIRRFALSLLIVQFFDIFTTYIFILVGGSEGNPFMAPILVGEASFFAMLLIKISIALLIFHSINLRIARYEIKEALYGGKFKIDLKMKEKIFGLVVIVITMTYWTVVGWNCMGIYFLLS